MMQRKILFKIHNSVQVLKNGLVNKSVATIYLTKDYLNKSIKKRMKSLNSFLTVLTDNLFTGIILSNLGSLLRLS